MNKDITFENAMEYLESAAKALKSGELTLEESIIIYEESAEYYKFCENFLKEAKQRIEIYRPETNSIEEMNF